MTNKNATNSPSLVYIDKKPLVIYRLEESLKSARKVAPTAMNVILYGETGVEKEVLARYIHENSLRKKEAFIAINIASTTKDQLEKVLFGQAKNWPVGGNKAFPGLFEKAKNGTLFINQIDQLTDDIQAKLIKVLDEKMVIPIGAQTGQKVNPRIIAATENNLLAAVERGEFRPELYYRLLQMRIEIPSLHERKDASNAGDFGNGNANQQDLLPANHGEESNVELVKSKKDLDQKSPDLYFDKLTEALISYMEHLLATTDSESVNKYELMDKIEKALVVWAVKKFYGNKNLAAKFLGISWREVYRKLEIGGRKKKS